MERAEFLERVRASLERGRSDEQRPQPTPYEPPPPDEPRILVERFVRELEAVGGKVHRAGSVREARELVQRLLTELKAGRVILDASPQVAELELRALLSESGIGVTMADLEDETDRAGLRDAAFAADLGLAAADLAVAETGTLVLLARRGRGRAVSLLPPVHVAVLDAGDIVGELAALFDRVAEKGHLPSAVTFVTGPSRTGDIELKLTVGVHGPREVHVVLIEPSP